MEGKVYIAGRDEIPQKYSVVAGESLKMTIVVLPGTDCDIPLDIDICGPDADVDLAALYLACGEQKVNISVNLSHSSYGSNSRQLVKGIASGESRVSFYGRIYVAQDSQKTKAYQENHNILASEKAHVETKPQLEIYADDVECSHGATIGKLSEDEQFYMRSRGIPEDEAKVLQMISFLAPVTSRLDEDLAQMVYDSLSECQA